MKILKFLSMVALMVCSGLPASAQNCQPADCEAKPCIKTDKATSPQTDMTSKLLVNYVEQAESASLSICDPKDCPPICRILCSKTCGDAVSLQNRSTTRAVASILILQPLPLRPLMVNSWSLIKKRVTPLFSSS